MSDTDGPIVAAVREAREKILRECGYDLGRLSERLRAIEAVHAGRIRLPKGKRGKAPEAATGR